MSKALGFKKQQQKREVLFRVLKFETPEGPIDARILGPSPAKIYTSCLINTEFIVHSLRVLKPGICGSR